MTRSRCAAADSSMCRADRHVLGSRAGHERWARKPDTHERSGPSGLCAAEHACRKRPWSGVCGASSSAAAHPAGLPGPAAEFLGGTFEVASSPAEALRHERQPRQPVRAEAWMEDERGATEPRSDSLVSAPLPACALLCLTGPNARHLGHCYPSCSEYPVRYLPANAGQHTGVRLLAMLVISSSLWCSEVAASVFALFVWFNLRRHTPAPLARWQWCFGAAASLHPW